ncbi:ROK family transcriptional regulator [Roseobacter sp. S98]|uniref:ROK family transcriptional regulator n=1 Tax=Roseobacter algicola (ex Choi et al. 2025) (nom. illeg.) TaxID=3092138 RepID=UPI003F514002
MDGGEITERLGGVNQSGVRNHNERLLMSMLQRSGGMAGSDMARRAGLSPQTVSVILRKLEKDGLLRRGDPVRGRVGKPSIPMQLNPDGIFAFGLKIGRRSADLVVLDFVGRVREQLKKTYEYPLPEEIFDFLRSGTQKLARRLSADQRERLCGIGIATPFELWKWHKLAGTPADSFRSWKDVDFRKSVAEFSPLPVYVGNDATAACRAEHLYGTDKGLQDYAYFFVGSFVGGGIVLNDTVFQGNQGNAGALGAMRSTGPLGESRQLIDVASIHLLETRLIEAGVRPSVLWDEPQDWTRLARYVDPWLGQTAQELSKAALSVCAVIDFQGVVIDGAFPEPVRLELVERVNRYLASQDTRGLIAPVVAAGSVGANARGIGAASGPISSQLLLDKNAGLSVF